MDEAYVALIQAETAKVLVELQAIRKSTEECERLLSRVFYYPKEEENNKSQRAKLMKMGAAAGLDFDTIARMMRDAGVK